MDRLEYVNYMHGVQWQYNLTQYNHFSTSERYVPTVAYSKKVAVMPTVERLLLCVKVAVMCCYVLPLCVVMCCRCAYSRKVAVACQSGNGENQLLVQGESMSSIAMPVASSIKCTRECIILYSFSLSHISSRCTRTW